MRSAHRPQLSAAEQARADQLDDIRDAINDLVRHVRTAATLTRDKGPGADGVVRPGPTTQLHRTKEPGLVMQLQWAAGHRHAVVKPQLGYGRGLGYGVDASWLLESETTTTVRYNQGGHSKPTSEPPTDLAALDLLADIMTGARGWRQRLGGKGRRRLVGELRALTGLAHTGTNADLRGLLADVGSWVRSARLALAYDATVVDLPAMVCPDCGGVLRVLADASSDVWCAGGPWARCVVATRQVRAWTPGCGATWPQGQWLLLLEAMEDGRMTITEFLEARLAEDEERGNGWWKLREYYGDPCPRCGRGVAGWGTRMDGAPGVRVTHVDRQDRGCDLTPEQWREFGEDGPADGALRLLREVAAKRAIITETTPMAVFEPREDWDGDINDIFVARATAARLVLHLLASVYADHPDYNQAWAQETTSEPS